MAEIAVSAGIDAGVPDVERGVDAYRLAVVAAPGDLRKAAHLRQERTCRPAYEIQQVEPIVPVLGERCLHHLRRDARDVAVNFNFGIFEMREHG